MNNHRKVNIALVAALVLPCLSGGFVAGTKVGESRTEADPLVQCVPGEVWYSNSFADDVVTPAELECVDPFNGGMP